MRLYVTIALLLLHCAAQATSWYAATNGTSGGAGTLVSPWSLSKALSFTSGNTVLPGDTIYLRGGTYWISNKITSYLAGTSNSPVVVRGYTNEWPVLTVPTNITALLLDVTGSNTWYRDFELVNVYTDRTTRTEGITANAQGTKFINLVIHEFGSGVYADGSASPAEWAGCIVYNNGNTNNPSLYHGIYCHSEMPGNTIRGNILFDNTGFGVHCFADLSFTPFLDGLQIFDNISFCGGGIGSNPEPNYITGGSGVPVKSLLFHDNYGFQPTNSFTANYEMGFGSNPQSDCVVYNNYFVGGAGLVGVWTNIIHTNNSYFKFSTYFTYNPNQAIAGTYAWDNNTFDGFISFRTNGTALTTPQWKATFGFDNASTFGSNPTTTLTVLKTNAYDSSRLHIAIYNWGSSNTVPVDLTGIFATNAPVVAINVQDYFGARPYSNVWSGGAISLPMTNLNVAAPVGLAAPAAMGPAFNAFVLTGTPFTNAPAARVNSIHVINAFFK